MPDFLLEIYVSRTHVDKELPFMDEVGSLKRKEKTKNVQKKNGN